MSYSYHSETIINGITGGSFEGGSLAFADGVYFLLDGNAASPRLIRLNASIAKDREFPLPLPSGYVGLAGAGNSVIAIRGKGTLCANGKIAVAELVSVDANTGAVVEVQEIYSYDNIARLGGLTYANGVLVFPGSFNGEQRLYRVEGTEVHPGPTFADSVGEWASLTADGDSIYILDGAGDALAFDDPWFTRKATADIALAPGNDADQGIAYNNDADIAVLDTSPLSLFFYRRDGSSPDPAVHGVVTQSDNQQLFTFDHRLTQFSVSNLSFDALFSEFVRSQLIPENGVDRYVQVAEIRVTPKFLLDGVREGDELTRGIEKFKITAILRTGANHRQSFICKREA